MRIIQLHHCPVRLHCFCDQVPVRRVQRGLVRPANRVGLTGRILELESWARGGGEVREGFDIRVEGVGVVDVEGGCIDAVAGESLSERLGSEGIVDTCRA